MSQTLGYIGLFAQAPSGGPSAFVQFLPLILIFVLFYFMIIRPQRRREQQVQQMLNALQKGDRVVTSSGIHGEIDSLDRDTLVLEIAPKVKVTIQRSAIVALSEARRAPAPLSESTSEEDTSPSRTLKKKKK